MFPNSNNQNWGFQILLETKLQQEEMGWILLFIAGKQTPNNQPCGFILFFEVGSSIPHRQMINTSPLTAAKGMWSLLAAIAASPFPVSNAVSKAWDRTRGSARGSLFWLYYQSCDGPSCASCDMPMRSPGATGYRAVHTPGRARPDQPVLNLWGWQKVKPRVLYSLGIGHGFCSPLLNKVRWETVCSHSAFSLSSASPESYGGSELPSLPMPQPNPYKASFYFNGSEPIPWKFRYCYIAAMKWHGQAQSFAPCVHSHRNMGQPQCKLVASQSCSWPSQTRVMAARHW